MLCILGKGGDGLAKEQHQGEALGVAGFILDSRDWGDGDSMQNYWCYYWTLARHKMK